MIDKELNQLKKRRKRESYKGYFIPKNPEKYKGDPSKIVFRSSWELTLMLKFDSNPGVIFWASEETVIQYFNPVLKRPARYFPDFVVKKQNPDGVVSTLLIEVKPKKETIPPIKPETKDKRKLRSYVRALAIYKINQAKWAAAREWCDKYKWAFVVMTEDEIGIPKRGRE